MEDGPAHLRHNALPPPMPYWSSGESVSYPSLVPMDVRSMMHVDGPSLSTCHMHPRKLDDSV